MRKYRNLNLNSSSAQSWAEITLLLITNHLQTNSMVVDDEFQCIKRQHQSKILRPSDAYMWQ